MGKISDKRDRALATLFVALPLETQTAILAYKMKLHRCSNHQPNNEITHIPLSLIDMRKSSLHESLWVLNTRALSDKYRHYLEAITIQPTSSQGYRIQKKFLRDAQNEDKSNNPHGQTKLSNIEDN